VLSLPPELTIGFVNGFDEACEAGALVDRPCTIEVETKPVQFWLGSIAQQQRSDRSAK
jgi:hypothetical protein